MRSTVSNAAKDRWDITAALGFRRVESVRVIHGAPTVAEVTGVTHRYPRTIRVSLDTAARLVRCGVPLHIEEQPTGTILRRSA